MPTAVSCSRGEHDFSTDYTDRGYECRNGCGTARVSRSAVLLVYALGAGVIGVRWQCYRPHPRSRVARGQIHPLTERERVFDLLREHERHVHQLVRMKVLPGQVSLAEHSARLADRGRRRGRRQAATG